MKKQQLVYIHGAEAFSNYSNFLESLRTQPIRNLPGTEAKKWWSSSLVEALGDDFEVFTPSMPNKQNAKYEEWKIWFERHFEYLEDEVILVGWSQGAYFLSRYLIENKTPFTIKALFLLAAPFKAEDFGGEDGGDFSFDTNKVGELATKANHIYLFHSKDDFVVPFSHAESYAQSLPEAELVLFEDKNHFLLEEFPELIEKIKNI